MSPVSSRAQTREQPDCPPADEWMKKVWVDTLRNTTGLQKEWNLAICENVSGAGGYHAERSESEKQTLVELKKQTIKGESPERRRNKPGSRLGRQPAVGVGTRHEGLGPVAPSQCPGQGRGSGRRVLTSLQLK